MTQQPDLVGRGRETALLEGVLAAAAGPERTSAALLVEGPAGIGKSAMLQHAARQWPTGAPLLRTEGVEPEIDVPFAGLHRLLRPVLDHLPAVPAPQAEALGVALGLSGARAAGTPTTARPAERFLVGAGVLSLVAEAAAGHGLLALVDDAHRLDRESSEALTFAARRLVAEGVVVPFAAADGSDFEAAGIRRLSLAGLTPADAVLL